MAINVKELNASKMSGVFEGSIENAVDSSKLGGETSEQWQEKIDNIQSSSKSSLSTAGWYRVAETINGYGGTVLLKIGNVYGTGGADEHLLMFSFSYNNASFSTLSSKSVNNQMFSKVRHTYDGSKLYLEVYYSWDKSNLCSFTVLSFHDAQGTPWKAITPTITEETISEVEVRSTYDIPSSANLVTDLHLAQVNGAVTLTTSILEKALDLSSGVYNYRLGGSSYTGGDLPHTSYSYGMATIYKRNDSGINVILWGYYGNNAGKIQYNEYNGSTSSWEGWKSLATTADLANYLPKSGGTVETSGSAPLTINNTANGSQYVFLPFNICGEQKGGFGFAKGQPSVVTTNSEWKALIHEGNVGSHALPITGGTMCGSITLPTGTAIKNNNDKPILEYRGSDSDSSGTRVGDYNDRIVLLTSGDNLWHYNRAAGGDGLVLDTLNYYNYALPLTGGTVSDTITVKKSSGSSIVSVNNGSRNIGLVVNDTTSGIYDFANSNWVLYGASLGGSNAIFNGTATGNLALTGGTLTGSLTVNGNYTATGYHYQLPPIYNYGDGVLIDICAAANCRMITIKITGNSYATDYYTPILSVYQFYDYNENDGIIHYGGTSYGYNIGDMTVYRYNGRLYAYIKQPSAFQTFNIEIISNGTLSPSVSHSVMHESSYTTNLTVITPIDIYTNARNAFQSIGGTITGYTKIQNSSYAPLQVHNTNSGGSSYTMYSNSATDLGFIGFHGIDAPGWKNANQTKNYYFLHDGNYANYALPLSGGTLTGQLTFASNGYKTNNIAGYSADLYGNLQHQRPEATDYFQFKSYDTSTVLKYYPETGNMSIPGGLTVSNSANITNDSRIVMTVNRNNSGAKMASIGYSLAGTSLGEIGISNGSGPVYRSTDGTDNIILHSGNYKNYVSNRVVLTGQCQTYSYRKSVIALCIAPTTATANDNSYSSGKLTFQRVNALYAPCIIDVALGSGHGAINRIRARMARSSTFEVCKLCTFTYNGVTYGGIEVQTTAAEASQVTFEGVTTFDIFALDYYDTYNNVALNEEVANSLSYDNIEIYEGWYDNQNRFVTENMMSYQSVNHANTAGNATLLKPTESTSTLSYAAGAWAPTNTSSGSIVWREAFKDSAIGTDSGDLVLWLSTGTGSNAVQLNLSTDGDIYAQLDKKVLHVGNYSSYALPLSGGTLSGNLKFSQALPQNSSPTVVATYDSNNSANGFAWSSLSSLSVNYANSAGKVAASGVTAGTFGGSVVVPASTAYTTNQVRNIVYTTSDPGAGVSTSHANGSLIAVYE